MSDDIQSLEQRTFFLYQDFVFFWRKAGDEKRVEDLVKKYGLIEAQKLTNHEHLSFYVKTQADQNKLAERLRSVWTKALKELFPNRDFAVSVSNEAGELVMTVRNT